MSLILLHYVPPMLLLKVLKAQHLDVFCLSKLGVGLGEPNWAWWWSPNIKYMGCLKNFCLVERLTKAKLIHMFLSIFWLDWKEERSLRGARTCLVDMAWFSNYLLNEQGAPCQVICIYIVLLFDIYVWCHNTLSIMFITM